MKNKKYIFVTGGVVSGLGKGITAASLGRLLKERGVKVSVLKLDPYMNVDPGTMSPIQHGEVFVTDDGVETDLDLGHYERFIDINLTKYSTLTSGRVYYNVLQRERKGEYLGQTVQFIPHITGEIKNFIYEGAQRMDCEVMIVEIGGTTGDIESGPFLEAIRQISLEVKKEDCIFIHVTLVPYLKGSNEHKSKPTQHSVKELRAMGISPDIIITRADEPIEQSIKDKISLFCNVKADCVIENITLPSLYEAPLMLRENGLDEVVCRELALDTTDVDLSAWKTMTEKRNLVKQSVDIAIVGKYVQLHDAYLSVLEGLHHAGNDLYAKVNIHWIDSEQVHSENAKQLFENIDGILIPGGFGDRGIEGKINACQYARENNVPYFGICLGMQIAVIEYARNVTGLKGAHSSEFVKDSEYNVIHYLPDQINIHQKGGTMRLGAYPCVLKKGSLLASLYGSEEISERHRHRYEFNNEYKAKLEKCGLQISGVSPNGNLVEAIEIKGHPFFVAVQFHPEFKSRPNRPHPIFRGFVEASIQNK